MNRKHIAILLGICMISFFMIPVFASAEPELQARKRPTSYTCSINSPADGSEVSGTIQISVSATRTPSIYIDGVEVARSYSYTWDTTSVADGNHVISAAYRTATDAISVTVNNGEEPPVDPPGDGDGIVNKYALCIGISNYEGTANDLTYCDDDARDWIAFFEGEGYTVFSLFDLAATYTAILDALSDLAALEDADDIVAVCYSGHGYYDSGSGQSGWVSSDLYLVNENAVEAISDTIESQSVFWFNDCCNIGTFANLANAGWVMGVGSTISTYTYDGDSTMKNGIYTYYAMVAIDLGYTSAEDICVYAANQFNAATPGHATTVDKYSGELEL
jgi:hypothetical protein